jgi:alpha-beta hydrolase superfamily lysophospholipase
MGTLVSVPATTLMPEGTLDGIVLSGIGGAPGPATMQLMTEGQVPPESVSRDPAIVKAYVEDPLVLEKVPMELLALAGEVISRFEAAISTLDLPLLLVHGEADVLCDVSGAHAALEKVRSTDKTLITYPELYHEVLNEPERDRVIGDVIAWLDAHTN